MPSRVLREGILTSRAVNALSEETELFYWHLLLVVDDYGRHEADPELLSVKCFPRRYGKFDGHLTGRCLADVSSTLTDDGHPLVTVYQVGKKKYLQVNNFNQRTRAQKSKCPSPDGQMPVICPSPDGQMTALARAGASSESDIGVGYRISESEANVGVGDEKGDDVSEMQKALEDFMAGKWGKPDRDIAEKALAACNGAALADISAELLKLHRSGARPVKSWGWFVTMLSRRFI